MSTTIKRLARKLRSLATAHRPKVRRQTAATLALTDEVA
jgi:hypothetical protein